MSDFGPVSSCWNCHRKCFCLEDERRLPLDSLFVSWWLTFTQYPPANGRATVTHAGEGNTIRRQGLQNKDARKDDSQIVQDLINESKHRVRTLNLGFRYDWNFTRSLRSLRKKPTTCYVKITNFCFCLRNRTRVLNLGHLSLLFKN